MGSGSGTRFAFHLIRDNCTNSEPRRHEPRCMSTVVSIHRSGVLEMTRLLGWFFCMFFMRDSKYTLPSQQYPEQTFKQVVTSFSTSCISYMVRWCLKTQRTSVWTTVLFLWAITWCLTRALLHVGVSLDPFRTVLLPLVICRDLLERFGV